MYLHAFIFIRYDNVFSSDVRLFMLLKPDKMNYTLRSSAKAVTIGHFLAGHYWTILGHGQTFTEFGSNKRSRAARPPKTFMSEIMSSQSSQLVSCSSNALYTLRL